MLVIHGCFCQLMAMPLVSLDHPTPACVERKISVIIAEDHCAVRELLVGYLRNQPHYILAGAVSTDPEVLQLCGTLNPDVLILDLGLPQLSGLALLPQLRKISPGTKVLIFTGSSSPRLL